MYFFEPETVLTFSDPKTDPRDARHASIGRARGSSTLGWRDGKPARMPVSKRALVGSSLAEDRPRRKAGRGTQSPASAVASPVGGRGRVLLSPVPEAVAPIVAASVTGAAGAEVPEPDVVSDPRTPGAEDAAMLPVHPPAEPISEDEGPDTPLETWAGALEESKDLKNRKYVEGLMTNDIMRQVVFFASKGKEKAPNKAKRAQLVTILRRLLPFPVARKEPAADAVVPPTESGVDAVPEATPPEPVAQVPEVVPRPELALDGEPPRDPEGEEEAAEEEAAEEEDAEPGDAVDGEDDASLASLLAQLRDVDASSRPDLEAQLSDTQLCLLLVLVDRTINTSKFSRKKAISTLNKLLKVCSQHPPLHS
jgi:hypothetical protein